MWAARVNPQVRAVDAAPPARDRGSRCRPTSWSDTSPDATVPGSSRRSPGSRNTTESRTSARPTSQPTSPASAASRPTTRRRPRRQRARRGAVRADRAAAEIAAHADRSRPGRRHNMKRILGWIRRRNRRRVRTRCERAPRASSSRAGALHVTKECPDYSGVPGEYCTIMTVESQRSRARLQGLLLRGACSPLSSTVTSPSTRVLATLRSDTSCSR